MSDGRPASPTRRGVLAFGAGSLAAVAGCSALRRRSSRLHLAIFNHADSPYTVELQVYRGDGSRSEARVYDATLDVPIDGETRREDIVEARRYLVRYSAFEDNRRPTDEGHVHYLPTDDAGDDTIAFDIGPAGMLTRR